MRLVVALSPERVVGIAMFEAQLAPRLDDAMFREIHTRGIGGQKPGAHIPLIFLGVIFWENWL
jgi:hypothetical protein